MSNPYSPAGVNTGYIPTATEEMVVGWSRNPASFRFNQYGVIKPVDRQLGFWQRFNPAIGGRIGSDWKTNAVWAPGADRPNGLKNQTEMEFVAYATTRFDEDVVADYLAIQQSGWAVEDTNARHIAMKALTRRTAFAHDALTNATWGTNTASVSGGGGIVQSLGGASGNDDWANGTVAQPNIFNSLLYAAKIISKATFGVVQPGDLCLVVNPDVAAGMATSPEIQTALQQSAYAAQLITGDDEFDGAIAAYNAKWGLPTNIRGFPIVIEDAVADITTLPGANSAGTGSWIMSSNFAYLLYRPGNLKKDRVAKLDDVDRQVYYPVMHTLAMITKEELTVESFGDPRNRRVEAHVVSDYQMVITSALSGFKFTNVLTN